MFFSWMQIVLFHILFYLYFVYLCTVYSKCFLFYICTCCICYSTPAALSIMTLMSYILFYVHPIFNYLVYIINTHSHNFASKTTLIFSCYIAKVKWVANTISCSTPFCRISHTKSLLVQRWHPTSSLQQNCIVDRARSAQSWDFGC